MYLTRDYSFDDYNLEQLSVGVRLYPSSLKLAEKRDLEMGRLGEIEESLPSQVKTKGSYQTGDGRANDVAPTH